MYPRTIQRRNKDGSVVRYVQLAHNVRHAELLTDTLDEDEGDTVDEDEDGLWC